MGINGLHCVTLSHVPDFEFLVITDRCELILFVMVPAYVFNYLRVCVV